MTPQEATEEVFRRAEADIANGTGSAPPTPIAEATPDAQTDEPTIRHARQRPKRMDPQKRMGLEVQVAIEIEGLIRGAMMKLPTESPVRAYGLHTARCWDRIARGEGAPPKPKFRKIVQGVYRQKNGPLALKKISGEAWQVLRLPSADREASMSALSPDNDEILKDNLPDVYAAKAEARMRIIEANGELGS